MYEKATGEQESPGPTIGGLSLNSDAPECPACGRALADHGFAFEGPGGRAVLSPCGLDVSGLPMQPVIDAIGGGSA